jgi:hypothetical protein
MVRSNVFHVLDGKMVRRSGARGCGDHTKAPGRVKALFELGFGGRVKGGSGGRGTTLSAEVEPVSEVWPETTATSTCVGKV